MQAHAVKFIRECGIMLRLKELRDQRRLTQEGLALKLSISQSTISAYETGERAPDLKTLISIANFFAVSIDYLAGLSNTKYPFKQSDLSPDELDFLYKYKQANMFSRDKIKAYMDGLLSE